jgi:phospholipid/cholesterol/gamma-HCH transport system ATP-binding protein
METAIEIEGLTKTFGSSRIGEDVSLTLPALEVSVLLGPSGTGKKVALKSLIGLLRPERGSIVIEGTDITECSAKDLYEIRRLFGVMLQDGALFRVDEPLRQRRVSAARAHQEKRKRNPRDRHGEAANGRPRR